MALVSPKFLGRRTNWTLGKSASHGALCALPSEEPLSTTMTCRRSRPSDASRDSRQRRKSNARLWETTTAETRGVVSGSRCCTTVEDSAMGAGLGGPPGSAFLIFGSLWGIASVAENDGAGALNLVIRGAALNGRRVELFTGIGGFFFGLFDRLVARENHLGE